MGLTISQLPDMPAQDGMMIPASIGGMTYKLPVGIAGGIAKFLHKHEIADVTGLNTALAGKAPAGFGLGNSASVDFNNATKAGFYYGSLNAPGNVWHCVFVSNNGVDSVVQIAVASVNGGGYLLGTTSIRSFGYGAWTPWDCINPPMFAGVEYRTTERWKGVPVFAQRYALGGPINGKVFYPTTPSGSIDNIVRGIAFCSNIGRQAPYWGGTPGTFGPYSFFVDINHVDLTIRCGEAYQPDWKVEADMYYIKAGVV